MPTPNPLAEHHFISLWDLIANPAAGADAVITRPGGSHVELILLSFKLTNDANVANRHAFLTLESSGSSFPMADCLTVQTANAVKTYLVHHASLIDALGSPYYYHLALPSIRSIRPADTWMINIAAIQVGDQLSEIRAHWKIWRGLS